MGAVSTQIPAALKAMFGQSRPLPELSAAGGVREVNWIKA